MTRGGDGGTGARRKPSPRTDAAELAIRRWIVQRAHRPGDRLPADVELAAMLGVARSTVITALDRLEGAGVITRRQGSGTYVRELPAEEGAPAGLEVLEPHPARAGRQGVRLVVEAVTVAPGVPAPAGVAQALRLTPGTPVTAVRCVLARDGAPCAVLTAHLPADAPVPGAAELRRRLRDEGSLLGELLAAGLPVAYARTTLRPVLVAGDHPAAPELARSEPAAAVEVHETVHLANGAPVAHRVDVLLPAAGELALVRRLPAAQAARPEPVPPRGGRGPRPGRGARRMPASA